MRHRSLFWEYLFTIVLVVLDIRLFGIRQKFLFDELLFLGVLLLGALSFSVYRKSSNTASFLLMIAFYFNLFLTVFSILNGMRSVLLSMTTLLSIIGILFVLTKFEPEKKSENLDFPAPKEHSGFSKPKYKEKKESKRELIDKELRTASLSQPKVDLYKDFDELHEEKSEHKDREIKKILEEIENKAKELNREIKGALGSEKEQTKKHKPASKKQIRYVAGRNSSFYHIETCPIAKRLKKKRYYESIERAENAGLKPHMCVGRRD